LKPPNTGISGLRKMPGILGFGIPGLESIFTNFFIISWKGNVLRLGEIPAQCLREVQLFLAERWSTINVAISFIVL
jgi:hypothetical protein